MPFDYILGVGKTPQVTKDIGLNPNSFTYIDVTSNLTPIVNEGSGLDEHIGELNNVINTNYDYTANVAYGAATSSTLGRSEVIVFDLGKDLTIKTLQINWGWYYAIAATRTSTAGILVQISRDNFINSETLLFDNNTRDADNRLYKTWTFQNLQFSKIKITLTTDNATAEKIVNCLNLIKIKLDNIQNFY